MTTIKPKNIPKTQPKIVRYFKLCSAAIGNKQHILSEVKAKTLFGKQTPFLFNTIMGKLVAREIVIGGEDNLFGNGSSNNITRQKNYQPVLLI